MSERKPVYMRCHSDISPDFKHNTFDAQFIAKVLKHEGKPSAIHRFAADHYGISDYAYWFLLGTLGDRQLLRCQPPGLAGF